MTIGGFKVRRATWKVSLSHFAIGHRYDLAGIMTIANFVGYTSVTTYSMTTRTPSWKVGPPAICTSGCARDALRISGRGFGGRWTPWSSDR